ncbi:MAG: MBL fold metallo-hydrolase [Planctomycetota bacterium]|jgi:glyoxylase-like metal-dependent hydrolase (beta-lactamase superfamily II)
MSEPRYSFHVTNDPMFFENAYTVYRRDGGPCWIIDPGLAPQAEQIIAFVRQHDLKPEAVLLTHAHGDHIAGVDDVRSAVGPVPLYLAKPEWPMLVDPGENLSVNIGLALTVKDEDVRDLADGLTLELDGGTWQVLDTSGHSPGGRSLYCAAEDVVIVGDALFAGSVGRVDFHHSDGQRLIDNICTHLMTLPDETRVFSGHGPETTIGVERQTNPYVLHGL